MRHACAAVCVPIDIYCKVMQQKKEKNWFFFFFFLIQDTSWFYALFCLWPLLGFTFEIIFVPFVFRFCFNIFGRFIRGSLLCSISLLSMFVIWRVFLYINWLSSIIYRYIRVWFRICIFKPRTYKSFFWVLELLIDLSYWSCT